jgi:hypothetical protein
MDALEKTIVRARLIASGIIRYWHCEKSKEVHRWLEILAEELASLKEQGATLKIREELQRYGLRVPEVRIPVHVGSSFATEHLKDATDAGVSEVCGRMK